MSASSQRIFQIQEELAKEAELERARLQLEALNAGVLELTTEEQWTTSIRNSATEQISISLWGSKDCRKCKAIKPKFVKIAGGDKKNHDFLGD
jgi:hypothetical protein